MNGDFQLLETMRVEPDGTIRLLARHLERLGRSARYFGYACDEGLPGAILEKAAQQSEAAMFRLLLARDGSYELQRKPLPAPGKPSRLVKARLRVNSAEPLLGHKTTARGVYERAAEGFDADTDVILVNERGEATETTIANIAVLRGNQWITPKLSCGVLPGTMRAQLLDEGQIVEGLVRADDLVPGETIRCFNAVRRVFDVPFEDILAT
jgi:para-aminobenzoate synthetase/4-amino-4-deoxychorismate lyase